MQYKALIGLLLSSVLLSGCIIAAGDRSGNDEGRYSRQRPTIGQELLDLDRAREAGVLDQAEYERTRARILERQ